MQPTLLFYLIVCDRLYAHDQGSIKTYVINLVWREMMTDDRRFGRGRTVSVTTLYLGHGLHKA